jgi:hypothetical protein
VLYFDHNLLLPFLLYLVPEHNYLKSVAFTLCVQAFVGLFFHEKTILTAETPRTQSLLLNLFSFDPPKIPADRKEGKQTTILAAKENAAQILFLFALPWSSLPLHG